MSLPSILWYSSSLLQLLPVRCSAAGYVLSAQYRNGWLKSEGPCLKTGITGWCQPKADRVLRYLRYGVLAWVLWATATSAKLIFAEYDPYYALFNFWTGEVAVTAFIALAAVVVLSLFIERPFCKYACPYGALLGLTNLFRPFSIRRKRKHLYLLQQMRYGLSYESDSLNGEKCERSPVYQLS